MWILRRSAVSSLVLSNCRTEKRFYTGRAESSPLSVNCLGTVVIKRGGEAVPKLSKTYPAGHGLPFAYARITVHFATINNCIFLFLQWLTIFYEGAWGARSLVSKEIRAIHCHPSWAPLRR